MIAKNIREFFLRCIPRSSSVHPDAAADEKTIAMYDEKICKFTQLLAAGVGLDLSTFVVHNEDSNTQFEHFKNIDFTSERWEENLLILLTGHSWNEQPQTDESIPKAFRKYTKVRKALPSFDENLDE